MSILLEQVFKLLTTEHGSLTYHLVLAFSIAGALQLTMVTGRAGAPRRRRMLLGLGLLLLLQLVMFAASGLAWQGLLNGELVLPALDRGVVLLSLVIIAWLLCFPDPAPSADAASLILAVVAVLATVFATLSWMQQAPGVSLNGAWPDVTVQLLTLAMAFLAGVYLLAGRPEGWGYGLTMLLVMAGGAALHLLWLPLMGSYASAVRLAQMVAYPFLLLLPQRLPQPATAPSVAQIAAPAQSVNPGLYSNPYLWQTLLQVAGESNPAQVARTLTMLLANTLGADICLLLQPPEEGEPITKILYGYDTRSERHLEPVTFDNRALPMFTASLRMGRARRFPSASTSPDLVNVARAYGLERTGNLLFTPVLAADGLPSYSLLLLAPYSRRDWTADEQAFMSTLARLLVQFLQRSLEMDTLKAELDRVRGQSRQTHSRASQVVEEGQKLRDQLVVFQENAQRDSAQLAGLATAATAYEAAQQQIAALEAELAEMMTASEIATANAAQQTRALDGEMRLALEEVAYLRNLLADADHKITNLKLSQVDSSPSSGQMALIRSIVQDLRQPLASITQQIEALLSEVAGVLILRQRKYLERVRVSVERSNRLLDDLLQAASPESNATHLNIGPVDVNSVVQEAVRESDRLLRSRPIALRLELPEKRLVITSDLNAVRKVLDGLLHNARSVTPSGGQVLLRVGLQGSDGEEDYVLLQVTDSGPGISPADLLRVFSPRPPERVIGGLNDPAVEMPRLKSLVELLGGRAWVDSEVGQGATFNVLLPVEAANGHTPGMPASRGKALTGGHR